MQASSVSGACDGAGGCDAEAAQANAVACSGGSAEVRPVVSPTAASSSILQPRSASRKRALEEDPTPTRRSDPPRRVSFSHVRVREHAIDVGGGGGVPSDDGPPLGLGWDIKGEHTTAIDDYEDERERERTPKDSYCMEGCVEPEQRKRMLLGSGSTLKQIKAATKAVVQLNHDRWKVRLLPVLRRRARSAASLSPPGATLLATCNLRAPLLMLRSVFAAATHRQASELLFGDAWLFRADRQAESTELLAMLGQPDGCGAELCVGNWDSAEACARELAGPLQVSPCELLSSASEEEDASEESGSVEEGLLWARASSAMQVGRA